MIFPPVYFWVHIGLSFAFSSICFHLIVFVAGHFPAIHHTRLSFSPLSSQFADLAAAESIVSGYT